ncbi:hypothetical protein JW992_11165 [candidate division KSB1 bacterium]|nr:hypothetical protein [candidate division KSB1 bacterium]
MQFFTVILLLILIGLVAYAGWWFYQQRRFTANKKPPRMYRLLVVLSKSQAGVYRFLQLSESERQELIKKLNSQWQSYLRGLAKLAPFCTGLWNPRPGLLSDPAGNWSAVRIYAVSDYQNYRACIALLEDPRYREMRNFLEIRLVFGDRLEEIGNEIESLI